MPGRHEQPVVAELVLDELRDLEPERVDAIAGAHRLLVLVDRGRPVAGARRGAAHDHDALGAGQQVAGAEAFGRDVECGGVGDAADHGAAAQRLLDGRRLRARVVDAVGVLGVGGDTGGARRSGPLAARRRARFLGGRRRGTSGSAGPTGG